MPADLKRRRPRKKKWRRDEEGEVKKGIYIVPNLFTTANLFSGFFGIVNSINGNYQMAAIAILVSCVFDILDGKVARLTGATSRFGVEYDSLADLVAFGVGPGLLIYLWALKPFGRPGWLAAFVFVACGALRLARFNVQADSASKSHFVGLPIPGAASMVATTVLFFHPLQVTGSTFSTVPLLVTTYIMGFLMVSTIPYNSFKDFEVVKVKVLPVLFVVIVSLTIVAVRPGLMLFILLLGYVLSGPLGYLWKRSRGVRSKSKPETPEENDDETASPSDEDRPLLQ